MKIESLLGRTLLFATKEREQDCAMKANVRQVFERLEQLHHSGSARAVVISLSQKRGRCDEMSGQAFCSKHINSRASTPGALCVGSLTLADRES
jgi:hypothetical protein